MPSLAIIEATDLKKSYAKTEILHGINLSIHQGEIVAIMGPSGSGKSTLLHCLAAIITPDSGQVIFENRRIDNLSDTKRSRLRRTSFGFVFQFSQLVPELTALDNVALPLLLNNVHHKLAYEKAATWLARVGLTGHSHKYSGELSGGEAQRVAIARAMVTEPKVLFADEPTGSLDSINSEKIMEMIVSTARESGTSVVIVTHEPTIAAYADREVIVRDGLIAS